MILISQTTQPSSGGMATWGPEQWLLFFTAIATVLIPAVIVLLKTWRDVALALRESREAKVTAAVAQTTANAAQVETAKNTDRIVQVATAMPPTPTAEQIKATLDETERKP